ncbi:MAG: hypothetical protein ABIX28_01980 [Vicinamibacterales bacterium]
MIRKLDRDHVQAEIASLDAMLARLPANDYLGRKSLGSRRRQLQQQLETIGAAPENRAQVALYFGGDPVIGSFGVQAEFGTHSLSNFQDLITKVWGASAQELSPMGPVPDKASAQLHITNLVHGSFGFLLEELDEQGEPLFETPLRRAADKAVAYIASFAAENEAQFTAAIEDIDQRVFKSLRAFFGVIQRGKATLRIVEGEIDAQLDRTAIERAWVRVEAADVDDDNVPMTGRLLGMIPIGRRFEFEPDGGAAIIKGKVGEQFSQHYLERMTNEQFAGRRWNALFRKVTITRSGRPPVDQFTLLQLDLIPPADAKN